MRFYLGRFETWGLHIISADITEGRLIHIDGKTLRGNKRSDDKYFNTHGEYLVQYKRAGAGPAKGR